MTKIELEKNWIISTAMIAFASALLLERSWQESNRSSELTPWVFWVLTAISLILIAIVVVPFPKTIRQFVLKLTDRILSVPLSLTAMVAFFVGWWPSEFEVWPVAFGQPTWWMQTGGIFMMLMLALNLFSAIRKVAKMPWWYWAMILLTVLFAILYAASIPLR